VLGGKIKKALAMEKKGWTQKRLFSNGNDVSVFRPPYSNFPDKKIFKPG